MTLDGSARKRELDVRCCCKTTTQQILNTNDGDVQGHNVDQLNLKKGPDHLKQSAAKYAADAAGGNKRANRNSQCRRGEAPKAGGNERAKRIHIADASKRPKLDVTNGQIGVHSADAAKRRRPEENERANTKQSFGVLVC
jgi:hypothetical protein